MSISKQERNTPWMIQSLLSNAYQSMRPAEQRVAKFLIQQGKNYPDFSLAELAELAQTSQSAVVHMCQKIGFTGFRMFRLAWVRERATVAPDTGRSELFANILRELQQTEALLGENIRLAAQYVATARQVFLFGGGGSGLVAELGAESLAVAGRMAYTMQADERITSSYFDETTAVVTISHKGENVRLYEAMKNAGRVGAKRIVITGHPDSLLAETADVLLVTTAPSGPEEQLVTAEVRAIQVNTIYALVEAVTQFLPRASGGNKRLTENKKD